MQLNVSLNAAHRFYITVKLWYSWNRVFSIIPPPMAAVYRTGWLTTVNPAARKMLLPPALSSVLHLSSSTSATLTDKACTSLLPQPLELLISLGQEEKCCIVSVAVFHAHI